MSVSTSLKTALQEDPANWSVRIALAEALQNEGNLEEATAVLQFENGSPLSEDHAVRAQQLLAELETLLAEEATEALPEATLVTEVIDEPVEVSVADDSEPILVAQVVEDDADAPYAIEPETEASSSEPAPPVAEEEEEAHLAEVVAALDSASEAYDSELDPAVAPPEADGPALFVAEGGSVHAHDKASDVPQKLSAFSMALAIHAGIFLLLSLIVIAMPRPNPPAVVATISQPDLDEQIEQVEIQRTTRRVSVASSEAPTRVVTAVAASTLALPEADTQAAQTFDVTLGAISGNIGMGMSFESGDLESDINFFGIRSSGSRIVLVIEAARFMLTDNKGGIPAYDKVKDDIAKMLSGLNRLTAFNIVLFEGKKIATFRDELVAASPSNIRMATEWLYPVNRKFEELGIREDYKSNPLREGIEPIPVTDLTHYIKAVQRAMEMDVNTMFLLTSGWVHLHKPLDERELERFYRQYNWGEKEEQEWAEAVQRARDWLDKENAARLKNGIPRRVIRSWHEIVAELEPGLRRKPGPGYSMEDVEDQVKEASNIYYRAVDKKKPELNIVWFIGEDEIPSITVDTHFKNLSRNNRGKMRILEGLEGLENVTGDPE